VFYEEAGVFDYQEAGGAGFFGGLRVGDSLLEPESFGVDGNGGIGYRGNVLGAAEDVDNIYRDGDVFEAGVGFFAEDFGFVGIDGDDFVADALEVGSDFVGGALRIGGETDNGDGFGGAEKVGDGVGRCGLIIWAANLHFCWMRVLGKRIEGEVLSCQL
jgi:hypothetical protein